MRQEMQMTGTWHKKAILLLSCLGLMVFAGLALGGLVGGELSGNIVFGLIVLACFADLIVPISYFARGSVPAIVQGAWILLSIVVMAVGFLFVRQAADPRAVGELGLIIGYPMAILSVPSGPIFSALMEDGFPHLRPTGFYSGTVYDWCLLFISGYVQWFIVFPAVLRVLARLRKSPAGRS